MKNIYELSGCCLSGTFILVSKSDTMINNKTNQAQSYFKLALTSTYCDEVSMFDFNAYGSNQVDTIQSLPIGSLLFVIGIGKVKVSEYKGNKYTATSYQLKEVHCLQDGDGNSGIDSERKCIIYKGNSNYAPKQSSNSKPSSPAKPATYNTRDDNPF